MLTNSLIMCIATALCASCFVVPRLFKANRRQDRVLMVVAIYLVVFSGALMLYGLHAAISIIVVGLALAGIGEALVINYRMVHSPHDQKHRRCY